LSIKKFLGEITGLKMFIIQAAMEMESGRRAFENLTTIFFQSNMKLFSIYSTLSAAISVLFLLILNTDSYSSTKFSAEWKAGVAKTVITPEKLIWMAGYGFRDRPAEGTLHDLWAKALVIEDADGRRSVLITTDLLGFPTELSNRIRDRIEQDYGFTRAEVILNSSHTHAGPVLQDALGDIYPMDSDQLNLVEEYSSDLENQIISLVGDAIETMEPANLFAENGVSRFQVNRRNNDAAALATQTELRGPNDYAVPVIKVADASGEIMAIAFGYACHPTTLSNYEWSGDYPGFAQIELEKAYPGAVALFFQGAGADQNPLPRRTVALAEQYGNTLAAAVKRVLSEDMRKLEPRLSTAYREVTLSLTDHPEKHELSEMIEELSGYQKRWAERYYDKVEQGQPIVTEYPYPLQAWKLGDQPIFSLGGELVVDYSIRLKRIFGQDIFVLGYSNDVMGYIPSERILMEGGYEGDFSQMVYGLPGKWTSDIESVIVNALIEVAGEAGLKPYEY
jgi:neutral ceramidase